SLWGSTVRPKKSTPFASGGILTSFELSSRDLAPSMAERGISRGGFCHPLIDHLYNIHPRMLRSHLLDGVPVIEDFRRQPVPLAERFLVGRRLLRELPCPPRQRLLESLSLELFRALGKNLRMGAHGSIDRVPGLFG